MELQLNPVQCEKFSDSLMVSVAQHNTLVECLEDAIKNTETYTEAVQMVAKKCNDINELVLVSMYVGAFMEKQRAQQSLASLIDKLRG